MKLKKCWIDFSKGFLNTIKTSCTHVMQTSVGIR